MAVRRGLLELPFALPDTYDNPFDPREVLVDALVRTPSGERLEAPCFFTQPHERSLEPAGVERWTPAAPAHWAFRWSPAETGLHDIEIQVRDAAGERQAHRLELDVGPSDAPGFVGIRGRGLAREDGQPFVPIGMNLGWWISRDPTVQIERVLARMASAGMNWTRLWLTHFGEGFTIEWGRTHPAGHYPGLGRYSLVAAARLDSLFAEATRRGIAIQLVLWQHSQLASITHSAWADNPYRAANGGPCPESRDFFTHPEAIRLSDQRLRYLVARYGAYESLAAWEVFNEMDLVMDAPLDVVAPWCAARAATLRSLDVHRHPITTSQAFPPSLVDPVALTSAAYDLGQCHLYAQDIVAALAREAPACVRHDKPTIVAEMGLGVGGAEDLLDLEGRHLHEASWAAVMNGFAGGAMSWWWDRYVDAQDHYDRQRGVARFVSGERLESYPTSFTVPGPEGLRALGRMGESGALVWVVSDEAGEVTRARVSLPAPSSGPWWVEQWDTRAGTVVDGFAATLEGDRVEVELRPFARDAGLKLRRVGV